LRGSDLSAITTKFVRRSLEKQIGASLDPMKKEINEFIEEIFVDFSEKEEERTKRYLELVVKKEEEKAKLDVPTKAEKAVASTKAATVKKEKGNKVEKKNAAAPKKKKKEKEPGEKRVIDWPVYTILPPMSDIIGTQLVIITQKKDIFHTKTKLNLFFLYI
jgi:chromatin remodeling complex protein RSC6